MLKNFELLNKSTKVENFTAMKKEADEIFKSLITTELKNLHLEDCAYSPLEAMDELGLDEELINKLIKDYVGQMIKALVQFEVYLNDLEESQSNKTALDYKLFRELAHKNLGVARNLRIKDSEILLNELMHQDDLRYLLVCMEALKMSVIKLDPKCAYNTLRLIHLTKDF